MFDDWHDSAFEHGSASPYLQNLGGYSITSTGLLMAPRGLGTMLAMVLAGRLTSRVDPRLLMFAGILMICASMWSMLGWTPDVDAWSLALTTFTRWSGIRVYPAPGGGFRHLRGDGTALFSLIRNVGSALGISISSFLLAQTTRIMHARIVEVPTPFNRMLQNGGAYLFWNSATAPGRAALNAEVTRQASIIAYVNDFKFMFVVVWRPHACCCCCGDRQRPPPTRSSTPLLSDAKPLQLLRA